MTECPAHPAFISRNHHGTRGRRAFDAIRPDHAAVTGIRPRPNRRDICGTARRPQIAPRLSFQQIYLSFRVRSPAQRTNGRHRAFSYALCRPLSSMRERKPPVPSPAPDLSSPPIREENPQRPALRNWKTAAMREETGLQPVPPLKHLNTHAASVIGAV